MNKILIFNPRYQIDVFVDWLGYEFLEPNYGTTQIIDDVLAQDIKIAALPYNFDQYDAYKKNPFDYTKFDLLLISDVEYNHPAPILNWIKDLGIKNYLFVLGAPFDNAPADWLYRPWWSFNIATQNTFQVTEAADPLYEFDILLGATRPHRDFVMAKLQKSKLLENSIVNYRTAFNVFYTDRNTTHNSIDNEIKNILNGADLMYPYISHNLQPDWEVLDNITNSVSDIVPWKIYQHTKYSVLCETKHTEFYLTEKTGKAFFAKRLFIVFSSYHYLHTLKQLGFQTFNGIIDESYDKEIDDVKRFHMAFEQMEWLAKQEYNSIMLDVKEILDHNHNHLLKYRQEIKEQMKNMVYNKLKEITC